jgi:AraC-like DNA-binding protein
MALTEKEKELILLNKNLTYEALGELLNCSEDTAARKYKEVFGDARRPKKTLVNKVRMPRHNYDYSRKSLYEEDFKRMGIG